MGSLWDNVANHGYSVLQSDGNSWKIDTFLEAITSELIIHLNSENSYSSVLVSGKNKFLPRTCLNLLKGPFSNCSDLIASHCIGCRFGQYLNY